jgi:hypothetical protein
MAEPQAFGPIDPRNNRRRKRSAGIGWLCRCRDHDLGALPKTAAFWKTARPDQRPASRQLPAGGTVLRIKLLIFRHLAKKDGAAEGTRTPDPIITNDVLYQLSYSGILLCPSVSAPRGLAINTAK